jgi:predicted HTH domain antitoxin
MVKLAFELDVPESALNGESQAELLNSVRQQAVLNLYAEQRITSGEAARMLDLTSVQLMELLRLSGVGFQVDLDEDDFQMVRQWRSEQQPKRHE